MSFDVQGPFVIDRAELRPTAAGGSVVELHYGFGDTHRFTELVEFDVPVPEGEDTRRVLRVLHLIAGVSYYKSIAPATIETFALNEAERELVLAMYDEGLREFAYRNGLPVPLPVLVSERAGSAPSLVVEPPTERHGALIPVGGGKDSALVADMVPEGVLMAVNPKGAHLHLAEHLGRPLQRVQRTLDPQLRELVAAGALNGHVPVTAINSAIAALLAIAIDRRDVLMGLERSASEPSLVVDGVEINHQFSKSARAEQLLHEVFEPAGLRYLSLLRPLTELAIGTSVAGRGLADDIVSCNRAFTLWNENEASRTQRPCGDCAKCLFTALMLAPSSTPEQMREHFGRDLLDEAEHLDPVRELWSAEKPFDCVGERHESAAAVALLARLPRWQGQLVPTELLAEALAVLAEVGADPTDFLQLDPVDELPEDYRDLVAALADELLPAVAAASDPSGEAAGGPAADPAGD
jgi:UDP-N-acetyl-alpha-D-muramoyl-L-alanyl-L-glutamate epimerase